jgi:heptosyltransferase-1
MMNILLVKLSSLGDVLHNLPVVWDIRNSYPKAYIAWVVEEQYVNILEPLLTKEDFLGIDLIIPISLRRWKKEILKGSFKDVWREFLVFRKSLEVRHWDVIIETQGLIKSALVTAWAKQSSMRSFDQTATAEEGLNNKVKVVGLANKTEYSGYEPLARFFYDQSVQVPFHDHAVDRSRLVLAQGLGKTVPNRISLPPQFYPDAFVQDLTLQSNPLGLSINQYVMCFHATARQAKCWDESYWVELGNYLISRNLTPVFPWGNTGEKEVSEALAKRVAGAIVPKAFSIEQAFVLIAQAMLTVGVDTGLTHLSAILNRPTIEIYVDSPLWKTQGYWDTKIINLGDKGSPPNIAEVITAVDKLYNL